jgi:hypothetical protein
MFVTNKGSLYLKCSSTRSNPISRFDRFLDAYLPAIRRLARRSHRIINGCSKPQSHDRSPRAIGDAFLDFFEPLQCSRGTPPAYGASSIRLRSASGVASSTNLLPVSTDSVIGLRIEFRLRFLLSKNCLIDCSELMSRPNKIHRKIVD